MNKQKLKITPGLLFKVRNIAFVLIAKIDRIFNRELDAAIISFHSVADDMWHYSNSKSQIEAYLKELSHHYKFITLSEMVKVIEKKQHYKEKVLAVTFDDGYKNLISIAPLLSDLGIKPTVFALSNPNKVNRSELDNNHEFLTESDLVILKIIFGWEVGSHTVSHEDLCKLKPKEISRQLIESRKNLSNLVNSEIEFLAYPKGRYNDLIVESVKKSGYKAAFTVESQEIRLSGDLYRIPRVSINHTHKPSEVLASLSPSVIYLKSLVKKIKK